MTVMGFTDRKTVKNIEIPLNLYKYQAMSNALSHQGLKGREGLGSVKPSKNSWVLWMEQKRGFLWEIAVLRCFETVNIVVS